MGRPDSGHQRKGMLVEPIRIWRPEHAQKSSRCGAGVHLRATQEQAMRWLGSIVYVQLHVGRRGIKSAVVDLESEGIGPGVAGDWGCR